MKSWYPQSNLSTGGPGIGSLLPGVTGQLGRDCCSLKIPHNRGNLLWRSISPHVTKQSGGKYAFAAITRSGSLLCWGSAISTATFDLIGKLDAPRERSWKGRCGGLFVSHNLWDIQTFTQLFSGTNYFPFLGITRSWFVKHGYLGCLFFLG